MKVKILKRFIVFLTLFAGLGGCQVKEKPLQYNLVKESGVIYRMSYVFREDFNNGELRSFSDYNFFKETAPCFLVPGWHEPPVLKTQSFIVEYNNKYIVVFECRDLGNNLSGKEFRLLLVGSGLECRKRLWNYSQSLIPMYRSLYELCRYGGYESIPDISKVMHEKGLWKFYD